LKTCVFAFLAAVFFSSCHSSAEKVKVAAKDSTLALAAPPSLDPVTFKRYHDLVSNFVDRNLSERNFSGGIIVAKDGVIVY